LACALWHGIFAGGGQVLTTKEIQMKTETIKKDYEIVNDEAKALFESLGVQCSISAPLPDVKDEWPNILYNVTFSKDGRNLSTEYRLGVGHVNWKDVKFGTCNLGRLTADQESAVYTIQRNPGAQLKNKALWASTAANIARIQKVAPKPYEVLAAICQDGQDAHGESWDNYAGNFGMDADSIKGRKTYDFCCDLYHQVTALIGAANVAKFAELHSQF
jgi:hypothetical protein